MNVSQVISTAMAWIATAIDLSLVLLVLAAVLRVCLPKLYALLSIPALSHTDLAYLCGAWFLINKRQGNTP